MKSAVSLFAIAIQSFGTALILFALSSNSVIFAETVFDPEFKLCLLCTNCPNAPPCPGRKCDPSRCSNCYCKQATMTSDCSCS